jgi:hypothetical protein
MLSGEQLPRLLILQGFEDVPVRSLSSALGTLEMHGESLAMRDKAIAQVNSVHA